MGTSSPISILLMAAVVLVTPPDGPPGSARESVATLAGDYRYVTDSWSESLKVRPDGRFSYESRADVGAHHSDEGTAEVVDGFLVLRPSKTAPARTAAELAVLRFLVVRWGKRLYLIPDRDRLRFCNAVNLGMEPRPTINGQHLIGFVMTDRIEQGWEAPELARAEGLPVLPASWAAFVLRGPIRGAVVEVLGDGRGIVDLGSEDGLRADMELLIGEGPPASPRLGLAKVVAVEKRRCTVELRDIHRFAGGLREGQPAFSKLPPEILRDPPESFGGH